MVTTKELILKLLEVGEKNPAKLLLCRVDFGFFPGNSEVPWESASEGTRVHGCQVLFKSHLLRAQSGQFQSAGSQESRTEQGLAEMGSSRT